MKETKDSSQKLYKIRIFKDFEFPSFSISADNTLYDLYVQSLDELRENFNGENYFELEVKQILPFKFTREVEEEERGEPGVIKDYRFLIKEIAIRDVEDKFGKLDYNSNPSIFDRRTRNDGSGLDIHSPYYPKVEVDAYYSERVKHYYEIIENKLT